MLRRTTDKPAQSAYSALYEALGHRFNDEGLLTLALTHASFAATRHQSNQRLEFLGDAVLGFVVSERLYRDANADEGHLSRMRANVVREQTLAAAAKAIGLGGLIRLGKGEETTGGRDKPSILADTMEAVLAAIYLDGGLEAARRATMRVLERAIVRALDDGGGQDQKTQLQQLCAAAQIEAPEYRTLSAKGPPHDPVFTVGVYIADALYATGEGKTKKEAEQQAARRAAEGLLREDERAKT
jgi:ribonuclease-3